MTDDSFRERARPQADGMFVPPRRAMPVTTPPSEPPPRRGGFRRFLGILVILVGLVAGTGVVRDHVDLDFFADAPTRTHVTTPPPPPSPPMDMPAVSAQVSPALVNIEVTIGALDGAGAGTGIVLTPDGNVLTSHHVVKGATTITVTDIGNGLVYDATTLGYDTTHDIALLQLSDATDLATVRIGDSDTVRVGDEVLAMGNAGGLGGEPTVSPGRATGLRGSVVARNDYDYSRKVLENLIEIEADVRAGQSGGALVNSSAEVVGVIAAASNQPQQDDPDTAAGQTSEPAVPPDPIHGYAVPIDQAMKIVDQIRAGEESETVRIGPTAILGSYVRDSPAGRPEGAYIEVSIYGSPGYEAGLDEGDIITAIDDRRVASNSALRAELGRRQPGDEVRLTVLGPDDQIRTVTVVLAEGTP